MSSERLIAELHDVQAYEIGAESKRYQVEVQLLEDTDTYVHVLVAVDDGGLLTSIVAFDAELYSPKGGWWRGIMPIKP
jgi:hypothetical protein